MTEGGSLMHSSLWIQNVESALCQSWLALIGSRFSRPNRRFFCIRLFLRTRGVESHGGHQCKYYARAGVDEVVEK